MPGASVEYQSSPCRSGKATTLDVKARQTSEDGPAFPPRPGDRDPEIVGDVKFQQRVREALFLLKSHDSHAHSIVSGYVGRIEQSAHSGMRANSDPPTFQMSDATAMFSVTWAAASIAHDAYHSKLYFDYKGAHPGADVPESAWSGTLAETKCSQFQVAAMRRVGAPQSEVDHALVNSDGHYIGQDENTRPY